MIFPDLVNIIKLPGNLQQEPVFPGDADTKLTIFVTTQGNYGGYRLLIYQASVTASLHGRIFASL